MGVRTAIADGLSSLKAFRLPSYGGGGGGIGDPYGWLVRTLPGSQYDYRKEAGALWENGVVASCLRWLCDAWSEAPMCVRRRDGSGKWVPTPEHPAEMWFNAPSPYYDAPTLWAGTLLSLKVSGDAYWYKLRAASGKLVGVVYLPHFLVSPRWDSEGRAFITHYEYRPKGQPIPIRPEDMVHLRYGIDPLSMRHGMRYLDGALREVCAINETSTYWAALLRNKGVPGVIIAPKPGRGDDAPWEMTDEQKGAYLDTWREKFGGDSAGGVFVQTVPVDVTFPAWNPQQLDISSVREPAAAMICATFGIDPMVIGLPSDSKTYSNYEEALGAAWRGLIKAMHRQIGPQLDRQLLPEFVGANKPGERIGWDYSEVEILREDRNALYKTLTLAAGGPFITPDEARAEANYQALGGKAAELRERAPAPEPGQDGADGQSGKDPKAARSAKAAIAAEWRAGRKTLAA